MLIRIEAIANPNTLETKNDATLGPGGTSPLIHHWELDFREVVEFGTVRNLITLSGEVPPETFTQEQLLNSSPVAIFVQVAPKLILSAQFIITGFSKYEYHPIF